MLEISGLRLCKTFRRLGEPSPEIQNTGELITGELILVRGSPTSTKPFVLYRS